MLVTTYSTSGLMRSRLMFKWLFLLLILQAAIPIAIADQPPQGALGLRYVYHFMPDSHVVDYLEVNAIYKGFPADNAGIKKGYLITAIDDTPVHGLSVDDISKLIEKP